MKSVIGWVSGFVIFFIVINLINNNEWGDKITLLLIIIYAVWAVHSINKRFFGFGAEKKYQKIVGEDQKELEKIEEYREDKKYRSPQDERIRNYYNDLDNRFKKMIQAHDDYLHLKERYRHSTYNKARSIENDWLTYMNAHNELRDCDRDYRYLSDEKLLSDTGEKAYKAGIVVDEIEKRFKKLLAT